MKGEELKQCLVLLADKYETKDFIKDDPIRFPRMFVGNGNLMDLEISAVISSWLAYGNRKAILKACKEVHEIMDYDPYYYLTSEVWRIYKGDQRCLYRFFKYDDFYGLMERLYSIYSNHRSLKSVIEDRFIVHSNGTVFSDLSIIFQGVKGFPDPDNNSACKRLNLLARWMVRNNSPVDIGCWHRAERGKEWLLIPLDTHVHKQALDLGITKRKTADIATAKEITDFFKDVFPRDPARGDFALFGLGIDK